MQLPHFIEKSHQFIEDHEKEIWQVTHWATAALAVILLLLLGLMAYMSFVYAA